MIVRPAGPADFPAIAAIAEAAYRAAFAGILTPGTLAHYERAHFALRFALEPHAPVVATDADGIALGFHLTHGGRLHMLFVDPARRARGIGAALLADAEARGATTLESFRDNAHARAFYERHGWRLAESYMRTFAGRPHDFVAYAKLAAASL